MKINSIINSIQQNKMTEPEKDKEKLRPIMSYYIINNHIYPNNFNIHQNQKLFPALYNAMTDNSDRFLKHSCLCLKCRPLRMQKLNDIP
jgi:hypothetical protein